MDVSKEEPMEETVLVGDDLMLGLPSPLVPPEIASHVLEGVDLCDELLKKLFLCLQINDIEPFCQDEIALYRQCAGKRDQKLRQRIEESERKLGQLMPEKDAQERANQLKSEVTLMERKRLEALEQGLEKRTSVEQRNIQEPQSKKMWRFW